MSCGMDTSGIPPSLDPHHAWTIVACPRCSRVVVTRRSGGLAQWVRRASRRLWACVILSFNAFVGALLLFLTIIAADATLDRLREFGADPWTTVHAGLAELPSRTLDAAIEAYRRDRAMPMVFTAAISTVAGVWLRASLGHIPPLRAGAGFLVVVSFVGTASVLVPAIRTNVFGGGRPQPVSPELVGLCATLSMTVPFLIMGLALGVVATIVHDELRSGFFAARVRAARKRRLA
jgi:hypothetical protein